jgi:hypothetical protein
VGEGDAVVFVGAGEAFGEGDSSVYEDEALFDPVVALSDSMKKPSTSPASRVNSGPERFMTGLPRGELPAP